MTEDRNGKRWTFGRIVLVALGVLLAGFILVQLVPVSRTNPPVTSEVKWDSPETQALAERACMDCHSNETVWPWYSYVAPVSWLVSHDVEEGRQYLNFSEWNNVRGEGREADEMGEVIYGGYMPPSYYVLLHPNAELAPDEQKALVDGLTVTIRNSQ